jgi:serine/threonine protein kinase
LQYLFINHFFYYISLLNLLNSIESSVELFDIIQNLGAFDEPVSAKIIYNILVAVDGLHRLGVVHRDIKVLFIEILRYCKLQLSLLFVMLFIEILRYFL